MEAETLHSKSGLIDAIRYFSDPMVCLEAVAKAKWSNGPECPKCAGKKVSFIKSRMLWTCLACRKQFSVKVGTIMEDSAIGLDKWLTAMWLLTNCKNGVSSYEVARDLRVTQKTAWFMLHRIRLAMQAEFFGSKLDGEVEVDETFIGGKARNMHKSVRARRISGRGKHMADKIAVMGMLERGGRVRTQIIEDRSSGTLQGLVKNNVTAGADVFTDELHGYWGLNDQ